MDHHLTLGHLDTTLIADRGEVVLRPLDPRILDRHLKALGTRQGDRWTLGGGAVLFRDGCVVVPWWTGSRCNRVAEEFALRLHHDTGSQIIDREHGRVIAPAQLKGLAAETVAAR